MEVFSSEHIYSEINYKPTNCKMELLNARKSNVKLLHFRQLRTPATWLVDSCQWSNNLNEFQNKNSLSCWK